MTESDQTNLTQDRVGIVLVNYNGGKFMPECLQSLAQSDYAEARVVVVDNGSMDGSADWVAAHCPTVALVRLTTNTGITGGNNAGIQWCLANGCDWVLLLNNDTIVEPDFLSRMMEKAAPDRMVVPKIYFHDDPTRINNHFGSFDYWRGLHRDWYYGQTDSDASRRVQTAPMANTCALLIPRAVIEAIGPMDERVFIYYDDTDFITRTSRAGVLVTLAPEAVIYHKESSSSGGASSPLSVYYLNRNRLYFMFKHQKNRLALGFFLLFFSLTRLREIGKYLMRGERHQLTALKNGILDFCRGRMGPSPRSFPR